MPPPAPQDWRGRCCLPDDDDATARRGKKRYNSHFLGTFWQRHILKWDPDFFGSIYPEKRKFPSYHRGNLCTWQYMSTKFPQVSAVSALEEEASPCQGHQIIPPRHDRRHRPSLHIHIHFAALFSPLQAVSDLVTYCCSFSATYMYSIAHTGTILSSSVLPYLPLSVRLLRASRPRRNTV